MFMSEAVLLPLLLLGTTASVGSTFLAVLRSWQSRRPGSINPLRTGNVVPSASKREPSRMSRERSEVPVSTGRR